MVILLVIVICLVFGIFLLAGSAAQYPSAQALLTPAAPLPVVLFALAIGLGLALLLAGIAVAYAWLVQRLVAVRIRRPRSQTGAWAPGPNAGFRRIVPEAPASPSQPDAAPQPAQPGDWRFLP